jgi:hypothetical protein
MKYLMYYLDRLSTIKRSSMKRLLLTTALLASQLYGAEECPAAAEIAAPETCAERAIVTQECQGTLSNNIQVSNADGVLTIEMDVEKDMALGVLGISDPVMLKMCCAHNLEKFGECHGKQLDAKALIFVGEPAPDVNAPKATLISIVTIPSDANYKTLKVTHENSHVKATIKLGQNKDADDYTDTEDYEEDEEELEDLVEEVEDSLGGPEITEEDYAANDE